MMQSAADDGELEPDMEPLLLLESGSEEARPPRSISFWELIAMGWGAPRLPMSWRGLARAFLFPLICYLLTVPLVLLGFLLPPPFDTIFHLLLSLFILPIMFGVQLRRFRRLGPVDFVKKQIEFNKCLYGSDGPHYPGLRILGLVHEQRHEPEEALEAFMTITKTSYQCSTHPNGAYYFHKVGTLLFVLGRYDEALIAFQDALRLRRLRRLVSRVVMELNCIAAVYTELGDTKEALEKHNEALKELEDGGMTECLDVAKVLVRIGSVQDSMGNLEESLDSLNKALDIYLRNVGEFPRSNAVAQLYEKIASVLLKLANEALAMENLQMAIEVYRRGGKSDEDQNVARLVQRIQDMKA